jgi:hypothetical protein
MLKIIMKDEVEYVKTNHYYIVNLDEKSGNGTHWTALICTKSDCMYFDSYGTPPPEKLLKKLKKMYDGKVYFSDFIMQDIKSVACGYYALAFLITYHKYRHQHTLLQIASKFIDYFHDDVSKNDDMVTRLYFQF